MVLSGDNNYTGGTTIKGGVLELNSAHAPGTGAITFAANTDATLQIDNAALTSGALTNNNAIAGFTWGDGIDFRGLTYSGATVTYNSSTGQASVGGDTVTLSGGIPAGDTLVAVKDAAGGTEVELAQTATKRSHPQQPHRRRQWCDIGRLHHPDQRQDHRERRPHRHCSAFRR